MVNCGMMKYPEKIFNSTSAVVAVFNDAGETVWINNAFEQKFGYSLAHLQNAPDLSFLSVNKHERFSSIIRQAFSGNNLECFDIPVTCADKTIKGFRWNTMLFRDEDNPLQNIVAAVGMETGSREINKSNLGDFEDRYRIIFENSGVALLYVDEKMKITLVNKEFERITGYPKDQVEDKMSWTALIPSAEDLEHMKTYHRLRRIDPSLAPEIYNSRFRTRSGEIRDIELHVITIPGITDNLVSFVDITEKRLAEEAIRKSEEKYRTLVDNMQDILYRCDLEGDIVFVSPSGARLLGYAGTEELIGRNIAWDCYYNPGERELFLSKIRTDGNVRDYEITLKKKDGSPVHVSTNSYFFYDPDGNVLGIEGILTDISRRKETERILQESEERLRGITSNIPGVVYQFYARDNGEYGMGYISERLLEVFGLATKLDDTFPAFLAHVHAEDRDGFAAAIRKAAETDTSWNFEGRFVKPSGEMIWFHGLSTPTRHKDVLVFDGILLDITQRKRAEEMSRQSEEKFHKIFMMAPECIAITQMADGRIIDINQGFEEITGWKIDEAIGRTSHEINFWVNPAERDFMVSELKEARDILHREFQFGHKDGSAHTGIYSARPIKIADKECLIFILQDITDQRRLEGERHNLERQLFQSQKLDAIGQLAGGVAHDFNNILMGIQGSATMLLMEYDPAHPYYQRLSQIEEQVKRGANLTRQLLGFARGGKYEVKTISVNDVIRKIGHFFVETRKEIEADFQLHNDVYPVDADAGQLEQVLINIFINAGHAMPKGGRLHIQTVNMTLQEADVQSLEIKSGDYVKISISDTGTGMDGDTLKRIFEPFFTTKSHTGGSGLGLASAYGIIRNHGGAIQAESEPGAGATFNLYLPSSGKKVINEDKAPDKSLLSGSGGILLVDDEPMILEPAMEILTMMGYTVYPVASGQQAVATYLEKQEKINLVILDMILPGMSGSQVLQMLKERNPDVKVILSSGYSLQGEVLKVMEMGCLGFIQKPYRFSDLSKIVHQAINATPNTGDEG